jgi:hypothetical protein
MALWALFTVYLAGVLFGFATGVCEAAVDVEPPIASVSSVLESINVAVFGITF